MKTMLKRSMAILLILLMVISAIPMTAMAATVDSKYLPVYFIMSTRTSSTMGVYTKGATASSSGVYTYTTSNASSSTSTYYPWSPSSSFLSNYKTTYKSTGFIPVSALKTELTYNATNNPNGIFQPNVWYRDTTNYTNPAYNTTYVKEYNTDTYKTAYGNGYTWEIYTENSKGVEISDQKNYLEFYIHILNGEGAVVATKPCYIENPFLSEDYTVKYSVTRTYDGKTTTVASNKTFASSSAEDTDDLQVVLSAVTGTGDDVYKFTSVGFNNDEYYLTYDYVNFAKLTSLTDNESKILADSGADILYKGTITITSKEGHYLRVATANHTNYSRAEIKFYQPVKLGYTSYLTIGGVTVMDDLDGYKDDDQRWYADANSNTTNIHGTLDLTSTKTFSSVYNIPIVNGTGSYDTRYTILVAESEQGKCSQSEFGTGSNTLKYYPELNGTTEHIIKFKIVENNTANYKYFNLKVKFSGSATEVAYIGDDVSYNAKVGNTYTLNLSSLVENFSSFCDEQKAQFTFTISGVDCDTASLEYGNYFTMYQGNNATTLTTSKSYTNEPGSGKTLGSDAYLDDYKVIYTANRATLASDDHGFTIVLKNTTSGTSSVNTYSIDVKFTASEGEKPYISTSTATISAAAGSNSSSVYLKNYIGNFSADLGLTYKITSKTSTYGTFYVGGSAAAVNATGSITASAPAIYYTANSASAADKTDTLTITVLQNSTTVGTVTYTGKVGTSVDCYTERVFNSAYPDDAAFAVVASNSSRASYTFDVDDFVNEDIDFSDDTYEDYRLKIAQLPIGGTLTLDGDTLEEGDVVYVDELEDLKYVRSGVTDTGIDCFEFTFYRTSSTRATTYTMWIVPNSSYLDDSDGYTEDEFKASYGKSSAFGVYASSSGITFAADDFTNSSVKLSTDYSDSYLEIVDEPLIGTLKKSSTTLEEGDRVAVSDLSKLKYTWEDYDKADIDCFTFYLYSSSSGSTKSVSTKYTMWIVGNSGLLSTASENWSGTSTTTPIYKVTGVEVSDNVASVTLDSAWVEEALNTVKTGSEVIVAVTAASEAKGLSLTVDKSLFTLSNAAKVSYITLSEGTTGASISVSVSDVLSAGGSGKDFTVTLNKLTISTANDIVANSLVASTATAARSVSFKAGTAEISFDSVGAAVLSVPYTNSSSYDDEMVVIFNYSGGNTPLVSSEFTGRYAIADIQSGGQYLVAVNSISFSDVSSNWSWTRGYIPSLAARGTISGMGGQNAGKYMPDGTLTRAEFIKLLVVSLGLEDNSASNPFSDMSDHWAKQVVAAAVKANIVDSASAFNPDTAITRKDMALYAYRAAKAAGLTLSSSGSTTTFKDESEITGEYLTAVKAMQAAGIINGMGGQYEGYYLPNNSTDRASAAKIIWFLNAELYDWDTSGKY